MASLGRVANEDSPADLAGCWRAIAGEKNWKGLINPLLNLTLRKEILRYGEFVQATYDNFDSAEHSKYCGSPLYSKAEMFDKVGLNQTGYKVERYLYTVVDDESKEFWEFLIKTPKPEDGKTIDYNWMGYIAVSTDEEKVKQLGRRDITIAWRGTICKSEWTANFKRDLKPARMDQVRIREPKPFVERGFMSLYNFQNLHNFSARKQVKEGLKRLLDQYKGEQLSITICGHSLGSALSILCAYDIAQDPELDLRGSTIPKPIKITVFSFGGPRVGNNAFRDKLHDLGVKHPVMVGTLMEVDNEHSPYLDPMRATAGNCHNMEQYLHLVDGHKVQPSRPWWGWWGWCGWSDWWNRLRRWLCGDWPFELTTHRDLALVNKSCDFLEKKHQVPECWWQSKHKGLVMDANNRWVQPERDVEDIPLRRPRPRPKKVDVGHLRQRRPPSPWNSH